MFFERLQKFFTDFKTEYVFEFIGLALLFYFVLTVLKNNNAKTIIAVFVVYTLVTGLISYFSDDMPAYLSLLFPMVFVIAIVAIFATEIKRAIWNSKLKGHDGKHLDGAALRENAKECINEIIKAVQNMSKNNVGAIIILSNSNMPTAILDSGVSINSDISSQLIESIFFPKTPLHDGAMIINGTQIQVAGCFLPLSQETNLPKELGTRHRAGIGITETINVTSIIVSEETGVISVAHGGKLKRYADTEMLKNTLRNFYWQDMIN
ncbi:MAG: DNA integrity scanning protein DisA nucleotide-binding domain protein [Candidatus Borkfalkiaceae bacterium]|nr:DNA integrity scanning protein DisA nucleotide-binding domain protein [Christensenellaceae bacterium]